MIKQNIFARPWVVTVKRGEVSVELIRYADTEKNLREALAYELSRDMEIVKIRERR